MTLTKCYKLNEIHLPDSTTRKLGLLSNMQTKVNNKTGHYEMVSRLMTAIRTINELPPLPRKPTVPSRDMILAQAKLIIEEVLELLEACGITIYVHTETDNWTSFYAIDKDYITLEINKEKELDLTEIAKELADVSVVNTGMFIEFGIADKPILEEVDKNNLMKFGPGGYLDENRKWRKPPNHPKPDIKTLLIEQGLGTEVNNETKDTDLSLSRNDYR